MSWRNEAITYRRLLVMACQVIESYFPEAMPDELARWWKSWKTLKIIQREKSSEFGLLQIRLAEEERKEECRNTLDV